MEDRNKKQTNSQTNTDRQKTRQKDRQKADRKEDKQTEKRQTDMQIGKQKGCHGTYNTDRLEIQTTDKQRNGHSVKQKGMLCTKVICVCVSDTSNC